MGGTGSAVGGTGTAVVGGVGGAAGVAGGLTVDGAAPGKHGIIALVGVLDGTPALGLDGFVLLTPDVVAGLLAPEFGICAGVLVPGIFVPGVAVAGGVLVFGAAGVVPGVAVPNGADPFTGTQGTVVGLPGVAGTLVVGVVVVGVVGVGAVVVGMVVVEVVGGGVVGCCASGARPRANAPANATALIDMLRLILTVSSGEA